MIRFKEFTDDWEQRKLGDYCEMFNGDRSSKYPNAQDMVTDGIPFINAGDLVDGHVNLESANKINREKYEDLSGAKLQLGDIVYCLRGTLGKNAYIDNFNEGTVASSLVAIRPKRIDGRYLFHILNSDIEYRQRVVRDEGAAQPNLSAKNVSEYVIPVPDIKEQKTISSFLTKLDVTITLHQRKYEKLLNIKKAMLGKMFPKKREKRPEIRFKGFTDDWEQRKLGDQMYIKSRIGWQALTTKEYLETGDYYLITGTDIDEDNHIVDLKRCYYVSKERYEMDDKIQVHEGDIIVTKDGTIGKVAMVTGLDKPATLNSHLFVLRDMSGTLDNRFLLQILSSHIFDAFVESTKTGSTLTGLPQKTFVEFKFLAPKIDEQKKISKYLDNLDILITLHQRKCEKLLNVKKALLKKMFP